MIVLVVGRVADRYARQLADARITPLSFELFESKSGGGDNLSLRLLAGALESLPDDSKFLVKDFIMAWLQDIPLKSRSIYEVDELHQYLAELGVGDEELDALFSEPEDPYMAMAMKNIKHIINAEAETWDNMFIKMRD